MEYFYLFYCLPVVICLITSWTLQILDTREMDHFSFTFAAFIPVLNIFMSFIAILMFVGWIGISIGELPTIIKNRINREEK